MEFSVRQSSSSSATCSAHLPPPAVLSRLQRVAARPPSAAVHLAIPLVERVSFTTAQPRQRTRRGRPAQCSAVADTVASATPSTQPQLRSDTWWQAFSQAMHAQASKLKRARAKLADAPAAEDFSAAAILANRVRSLEASDGVAAARAAIDAAVSRDAYADAAALRDGAHLPLLAAGGARRPMSQTCGGIWCT
jgi:hypothetical protein